MLIPFTSLLKKYAINPKGVLHIGANDGAEVSAYYSNGVERTMWVEAVPSIHEKLKRKISGYPNAISFNACIAEKDFKNVEFNVSSNNGESSSLLDFGTHSDTYPDITFVEKLKLTTIRIDTLVTLKEVNIGDYDFLNIDLQGSELSALKSMGDMLRGFNWVYVEINRDAVYKGCAQVEEITAYLNEMGFEFKEAKWSTHGNWGDGFYVKDSNMNSVFNRQREAKVSRNGMVKVPPAFLTDHPFPYPPDNRLIFEKWYYANFVETPERLYLPVQWTGYHCTHSFGNDEIKVKELQDYVDTLDRSKKYYTIHQFDLGCLVDFKDLDILVFGMAGGRIDYCLPLLCTPHRYEVNNPKTIFASFIGRRTHPIRTKIVEALKYKQGCYVSEAHHDLSAYCSMISSSIFTICGRGYGNNSFRVQEALQYGSIPVIVSDSRLEPHGIPFENYAVYIDEKDAGNVYEILQNLTVDEVTEKQSKLKYYFDNYFSYGANRKIILDYLKNQQ